jgi:hypothetical protein
VFQYALLKDKLRSGQIDKSITSNGVLLKGTIAATSIEQLPAHLQLSLNRKAR